MMELGASPNERQTRRTGRDGLWSGNDAAITWCTDQPIWNNGGDTALLLDPAGRIVAVRRY